MARTFDGPYGSATGSGGSLTLNLDGTAQPSDLILVAVLWEPHALPETYVTSQGHTNNRFVELDDTWLGPPGDIDFTDEGWTTVFTSVGFNEIPRAQAGRGPRVPYQVVSGLPPYPAWPEAQPSGIGSRMFGLWYPELYDTVSFTFYRAVPVSRPFSVSWCHARAWRIAEWGGPPVSKSGTVGSGITEPGETTYDAVNPVPPPEWTDLWQHACPQGGLYGIAYPSPGGSEWISDGGDTERHWGVGNRLVSHHIEYGLAARYGQGEGTFTWDTWPGIPIGSLDRGLAHYEFFYNLDVVPAANACGTFGPQAYTQSVPAPDAYRSPGLHPAYADSYRGGAMLRGAAFAVAGTAGGWMPQIYRRLGPAQ